MRLVIAVMLVLIGIPELASAQRRGTSYGPSTWDLVQANRGYGSPYGSPRVRRGYGGGYGYYDPATIQQMLSLPDTLNSCQFDFGTNPPTVQNCRTLIKSADSLQMFGQNPDGILTGIHSHKGAVHFRILDNTNTRITTMTGGGLAGAGGAAIGGAFKGRRGAAIGGVAGGIIGGILGSRNTHDNCFTPNTASAVEPENMEMENGSVPTPTPALRSVSTSVTWSTVNMTDFRAIVTDPNSGQERLIPAGGSINLPEPTGEQPYAVVLLAPGRGSIDRVPGEIRPSQDLQGWEIVAR